MTFFAIVAVVVVVVVVVEIGFAAMADVITTLAAFDEGIITYCDDKLLRWSTPIN